MRFLVDMPVTPQAVEHLGRAGHEAAHAAAVGLATVSNAEILAAARLEGRIVVTADLDYPRLLALEDAEGPGVILFRGGSYSDREMLELLDRVLATVAPVELAHSVTVVDWRWIRRRHLPILWPIAGQAGRARLTIRAQRPHNLHPPPKGQPRRP